MDGLKNYREKIKSIEKLVDKLEKGELSIHELVELETLTRELHERSIILKYKAFESAGAPRNEAIAEPTPVEKTTAPVVDLPEEPSPIIKMVNEVTAIAKEAIEAAKPAPRELPEMDFSLFDTSPEPEEKPEIKPANQPSLPENELTEKKSEPVTPAAEIKPEPVAKEEPKPVVQAEEKPELITEEPLVVVKEKGSSFLDRLTILDNSIGSQIAGRKLSTLSGAFGINERLLYINELFDGSGEAFSDAVKILDSQTDLDAASAKVEEFAFKNSWNPEEEVVLEFLAIIKRRYA